MSWYGVIECQALGPSLVIWGWIFVYSGIRGHLKHRRKSNGVLIDDFVTLIDREHRGRGKTETKLAQLLLEKWPKSNLNQGQWRSMRPNLAGTDAR